MLFAKKQSKTSDKEWNPKLYPKLDFKEDNYIVLEVDPKADQITIKKAYYKMALKYHPDNRRNEDDKSLGNKQMMVINAAYKVLKNEQSKAEYDNRRSAQATRSSSSSTSNRGSNNGYDGNSGYNSYECNSQQEASVNDESSESFLDIFADMWKDLRLNNGANLLLNDLTSFLDNQVVDVSFSSFPKENIEKEKASILKTISNLEAHGNDLKKALDLQQVMQLSESMLSIDIEARLRRIETIKGLEARIVIVNKQLRQLKNQKESLSNATKQALRSSDMLDDMLSEKNQEYKDTSRKYVQPNQEELNISKQQRVEDALQQLKNQMGII